jgi:3(or 17)beta-hydroxysteroid dehydrogenase
MLDGMLDVVSEVDPEAAAQMDEIWVSQPQDVANMVLFLASNESAAENDSEMVVDNTATITEGVVPKF